MARCVACKKGGNVYYGRCLDCTEFFDNNEVRCPKCGNKTFAVDDHDYALHDDGEHEVHCEECDHKFHIQTTIVREFTSPEMLTHEEKNV